METGFENFRSTGVPNTTLDEKLRKQVVNFQAFSRTVSGIKVETITEKWEFEDVLKSLQTRWSGVDTLHWEIVNELDGVENQDYEAAFTSHETTFQDLKRTINSKLWSVCHREKSTPKIDIPMFDGNYQDWVSFIDIFNETIHLNPSLSSAQKMQFLKSKVKGEPERLIQHLAISSSNYNTAWDTLNRRYNNLKLLFTSNIDYLLDIPAMQQASHQAIKRLHDNALESLNAIKNLGVNIDTWDPLLVHILAGKLDPVTKDDYMESLSNPKELPKLKDFLKYLESKFTYKETSSRSNQDKPTPKQATSQSSSSQSSSWAKRFQKSSYNKNDKQESSNNKNQVTSSHAYKNKPKLCCAICRSYEHRVYFCPEFLAMSPHVKRKTVQSRNLCNNCLHDHQGNACTSNRLCRVCSGQHNSLLHEAFAQSRNTTNKGVEKTHENSANKERGGYAKPNSHVSQQQEAEILLATAVLNIQGADGREYEMRALIDQGSQVSLITEKAAQVLGVKRQQCKGTIFGVGEQENRCKGVIKITCSSIHNDFTFDVNTLIMTNLIKKLPSTSFAKPSWSYIQGLDLADPEFNISRPVDLLLGADIYSTIMLGGIIKGEDQSQPIAQLTQLGWLLCGNVQTSFHCNVVLNDLAGIQKFWEIEDITEEPSLSEQDDQCILFYKSTTKRLPDGKYQVRLPLKKNYQELLGTSKPMAVAQFMQLERKFNKKENFAKEYKLFIDEYQELGHMKQCTVKNMKRDVYLPHHGVERPESTSTSLRVVFNASAKTSSGLSLNDVMERGPNLQQDLQSLIMKWRQYEFAFTADIKKFFRQIWVHEYDQALQKIVWRDQPNQPLRDYKLMTVTYGTKAAPFLCMMTLRQLASDEREKFKGSDAISVIQDSFYMDDLLHGAHSLKTAQILQNDLIKLLGSGGMDLRKWKSNKSELLQNVNKDENIQENFDFKQVESTKTLGLRWNTQQDVFTFQSKIEITSRTPTKRSLLSDISKIFDPLGCPTPFTTKLKLIFQQVWLVPELKWDSELPPEIQAEWLKIRSDIENIKDYQVNRWLVTTNYQDEVEMHGFCDASTKAYGAVIYCKIIKDGQVSVVLVVGKARLVPTSKQVSLPRLELSGAHLLSRLMAKVQETLGTYNIKIYGWTDSTAVLGWLQGNPSKWKPFVANRVRQVTEIMPADCWRYVKSAENPADCASRGITASQLSSHSLWWNGPSWLAAYQAKPSCDVYETNQEIKKNIQVNVVQHNKDIVKKLLSSYSSFTKVVRVLAWVLRFAKLCKKEQEPTSFLTVGELRSAKLIIMKQVQDETFQQEISDLQKSNLVHSKSKISNLHPYLDQEGILRVGGRLKNAHISYEMKHPIILPREHTVTQLLIDQAHELTFHGGARLTAAFIRQKYWIIGGNRVTKKRIRECVKCRKVDPEKHHQMMGDLPEARTNPSRPFYNTGVDLTGHIMIKANKGRGIKTTKGYVVVFVCMATKNCHLEVVSDLTAVAFLAALRRMAARKGCPRHIFSDNGKNFVLGDKLVQQAYEEIQEDQEFLKEITEMEISWHFNAPSWPSAGGLWEAAVKSLKYHLKRVVGEQRLTFEEYSTVLAQIEAVMNSRPLCPLTEDPQDLDFLTPAHFLACGPNLTLVETEKDQRTRWYLTQKIFNDVWKRWQAEYLSQLTTRCKWNKPQRNIMVNDVVLIHDANLPAGKWAMGRVIELHPGKDGLTRVVTLKTKNGVMKRPIVKISRLPIKQETAQEPVQPSTPSSSSNRTSKRKTNFSFASMATSLLFFVLCMIGTTRGNHAPSYNISRFNDTQGLYFDKISSMSLIRDEWKVVVYYNLDPYWQGMTALNKYTSHLDKMCNVIKERSHCDIALLQLRHEYSELEYYNRMLLSQHTSTRQTSRLHRRGLINGVGYVANTLFGVLDERFAEQYQEDIKLLRDNQQYLSSLWRNQTSIIEAEHNLLQRTEEAINIQYKIMNQHIIELSKAEYKFNTDIQILQAIIDFNSGALIASNMAHHLRSIQGYLLDTLTDVYHGKFNLHLLTPEQLRSELSIISSQASSALSLPIDNLHQEFSKIYQFIKIKARLLQEYMIFELRIPLIAREPFELFKIIPIPIQSGNMTTSIVPITDIIAINLRKDSYLPLTEYELGSCFKQGNTKHTCYLRKPVYQMKGDLSLCELDDSSRCKVTTKRCSNKWTEISIMNSYFYFCCEQCQARLICGDQVTAPQLTNAGIISLGYGCLVKTREFTAYAHRQEHNVMQSGAELYVPQMAPINHVINISVPKIDNISSYEPEHKERQEVLARIHEQIKAMKDSDVLSTSISYHDVHHYALGYTILGVIAIIGAALACRRCRQSSRPRTTAASPAPAAAVEAAAEQELRRPPAARARPRPPPQAAPRAASVSASDQVNNGQYSDQVLYSEISKSHPRVLSENKATSPIAKDKPVFTISGNDSV